MSKKKEKATATSFSWDALHGLSGMTLLDDLDPITFWIDTGVLGLNFICSGKFVGGGVPGGRICELYGDSATGKSLIGMNILRGVQTMGGIPVLLDAEQAISKDFAIRASKIDPTRIFITDADTLEGCFAKIYAVIRDLRESVPLDVPICIVYDSIAASPSEREFAETVVDMANASQADIKRAGAGSDMPGERAKTCSKHFRNLPKILKANNATLVVINQLRKKIGISYGDDSVAAGGGRALEYYATTRVKLRANKQPKDKNGRIMGANITMVNTKARCTMPYQETKNVYLFFKQGINPFSGLLDLLIQNDRVVQNSVGNYQVLEPYAGGQEIKFKSSAERNDVPAEVLIKCPALVDATSPDQIQYYLDLYNSAIDATDNDIASEDAYIEE